MEELFRALNDLPAWLQWVLVSICGMSAVIIVTLGAVALLSI